MKKILISVFLVIISLNLNASSLENFDIKKISKPELEVIELYFDKPLHLKYIHIENFSKKEKELDDNIPHKRKCWNIFNIFKK